MEISETDAACQNLENNYLQINEQDDAELDTDYIEIPQNNFENDSNDVPEVKLLKFKLIDIVISF